MTSLKNIISPVLDQAQESLANLEANIQRSQTIKDSLKVFTTRLSTTLDNSGEPELARIVNKKPFQSDNATSSPGTTVGALTQIQQLGKFSELLKELSESIGGIEAAIQAANNPSTNFFPANPFSASQLEDAAATTPLQYDVELTRFMRHPQLSIIIKTLQLHKSLSFSAIYAKFPQTIRSKQAEIKFKRSIQSYLTRYSTNFTYDATYILFEVDCNGNWSLATGLTTYTVAGNKTWKQNIQDALQMHPNGLHVSAIANKLQGSTYTDRDYHSILSTVRTSCHSNPETFIKVAPGTFALA